MDGMWQQVLDRLGTDFGTLGQCGIDGNVLARLRADAVSRQRIADLIANDWVDQLPPSEMILARVLGYDGYFGSRSWSNLYWQFLSDGELANFPHFPWPMGIFNEPCPFNPGKKVQETHSVLLARRGGPDRRIGTIQDMIELQRGEPRGKLEVSSGTGHWLKFSELIVTEPDHPEWHLVVTAPVLHGYPYDVMVRRTPPAYRGMTISLAALHMLTYHHRRDEWPFGSLIEYDKSSGLTATAVPPSGSWRSQYYIGMAPNQQWPDVSNCSTEASHRQIGLFVERKPPSA